MAVSFDVTVTIKGTAAEARALVRAGLKRQLHHLNAALGKTGDAAYTEEDIDRATDAQLKAGIGVVVSYFFGQECHAAQLEAATAAHVVPVREAGPPVEIADDIGVIERPVSP